MRPNRFRNRSLTIHPRIAHDFGSRKDAEKWLDRHRPKKTETTYTPVCLEYRDGIQRVRKWAIELEWSGNRRFIGPISWYLADNPYVYPES